MAYDPDNVFAKILRGEIPCKKVFESVHSLAFHDINPAMPVHVLVIPKGPYRNTDDFAANASAEEIADHFRTVGEVARMMGVVDSGYRIMSNTNAHANQEVPHFHTHVFGGQQMVRRMVQGE